MITPSFFSEYDEINNLIHSLMSAETDIEKVTVEIQNAQQQITNAQKQLETASVQEQTCVNRIQRNENPRFFHFLVQNRKQKIVSLKEEHKTISSLVASLRDTIRDETEKKNASQKALDTATQNVHLLDICLARRQNMFDECISAFPSSPCMVQMEKNIEQTQKNITQEISLIQKLTHVVEVLQQADVLFQQSMNEFNRTAMWNSRAVRDEHWSHSRSKAFKNQYFRDILTTQACLPAMQAYELVSQAMQAFPETVRDRFPDLASQLSTSSLPKVQSSSVNCTSRVNMYGYTNFEANGMNSEYAIQQSQQNVAKCVQITQQQIADYTSIINEMNSNLSQLKNKVQSYMHDRDIERIATFEYSRQLVCHPYEAKMGCDLVIPMAQPVN